MEFLFHPGRCVGCVRCIDACTKSVLRFIPGNSTFQLPGTPDQKKLLDLSRSGMTSTPIDDGALVSSPGDNKSSEECVSTNLENIKFPLSTEAYKTADIAVLRNSLHCRHLDVGSCNGCDNEMIALGGPHYDVQRLGIDFVASPRHADALTLTGPISRNSLVATYETFTATPKPRLVFAVGNCACSGGIFEGSYAVFDGASKVVPVTIRIPGCPPTPGDILNALTEGLKQLQTICDRE
ncbi:MAG: 4Fe-4S ferredoxin [Candidatus Riflebacteria bacterium]|nr:4Fe-4S ferredoxin [Candidatus Riflebacteria bacterium]